MMVTYLTLDTTAESPNFQKEIANMLHGFGDNPNPNAATVLLIENIVLQQLRSIIQEALNIATIRDSRSITNYDIIYVIRKNIYKLKKLYDYQNKLENIDNKQLGIGSNPTDLVPGLILEDEKDLALKKKRTHISIIEDLDEADEVKQITFNSIDYLRKIRAAKVTETMSFEKYEAYHKARCTSFRSKSSGIYKNHSKLEMWVNPTKELKLSHSALEVLGFLGYETIAEIVDAVFLIRQDAKKRFGDPFSKFDGGHFCNTSSLSNAAYTKSGYEGVAPITVAEVREVMRRYFSPTNGMNGLFYRNMGMELPARFIAI